MEIENCPNLSKGFIVDISDFVADALNLGDIRKEGVFIKAKTLLALQYPLLQRDRFLQRD